MCGGNEQSEAPRHPRRHLKGVYDLAALQQRFAVVFVRMQEDGRAPSRLQGTGACNVKSRA